MTNKDKVEITRKKVDQVDIANLIFEFYFFVSIRWRKAKTATLAFSFLRTRKAEKKKEENVWRRRISFFLEEKKNREGKRWNYLEKNSPKIVKDV